MLVISQGNDKRLLKLRKFLFDFPEFAGGFFIVKEVLLAFDGDSAFLRVVWQHRMVRPNDIIIGLSLSFELRLELRLQLRIDIRQLVEILRLFTVFNLDQNAIKVLHKLLGADPLDGSMIEQVFDLYQRHA